MYIRTTTFAKGIAMSNYNLFKLALEKVVNASPKLITCPYVLHDGLPFQNYGNLTPDMAAQGQVLGLSDYSGLQIGFFIYSEEKDHYMGGTNWLADCDQDGGFKMTFNTGGDAFFTAVADKNFWAEFFNGSKETKVYQTEELPAFERFPEAIKMHQLLEAGFNRTLFIERDLPNSMAGPTHLFPPSSSWTLPEAYEAPEFPRVRKYVGFVERPFEQSEYEKAPQNTLLPTLDALQNDGICFYTTDKNGNKTGNMLGLGIVAYRSTSKDLYDVYFVSYAGPHYRTDPRPPYPEKSPVEAVYLGQYNYKKDYTNGEVKITLQITIFPSAIDIQITDTSSKISQLEALQKLLLFMLKTYGKLVFKGLKLLP